MKIDPESYAFPSEVSLACGLTVRSHFAAMAMQGVLADPNVRFSSPDHYEEHASVCVKMADALIAALNKEA